jgi:hypothetical protein
MSVAQGYRGLRASLLVAVTAAGCERTPPCVPSMAALVEVGASKQFTVGRRVFDSDCRLDGPLPTGFVWSGANPSVAEVSPDGRVLGIRPGNFKLTATKGSTKLVAEGFVLPPGWMPTIEPTNADITVGETLSFLVYPSDGAGRRLPLVPFFLTTPTFTGGEKVSVLLPVAHLDVTSPVTFTAVSPGTTVLEGSIAGRTVKATVRVSKRTQ